MEKGGRIDWNSGRIILESMAGLNWNGGRITLEWVAGLPWNTQATYDASRAPGPSKFINAEAKIKELVNQMLVGQ